MNLLLLLSQILVYFCRYNGPYLAELVSTPALALAFLQSHGVVRREGCCDKCQTAFPPPRYRADLDHHYFKCLKCKHEESIYKHTYLYQKNITMRSFVMFAYHFCMSQVC